MKPPNRTCWGAGMRPRCGTARRWRSRASSPAIKAHLIIGPYICVPGTESLDLTVSPATSGTLSGQLALNSRQATAFRTGKTYVQIDTRNAPTGTLWGWLLPSHEDAAPNVPQTGPWFLPQLNTPSR